MMRFRSTLGICALGLLALSVRTDVQAQQDPQSSTYFLAPQVFNPAYSGLSNRLNVHSVTRMQWVGWGGAPATQMLTMDAPFFRQFGGAGLTMVRDNVGARSQTSFMGSVAAHIPLDDGWTMSFGICGGMRLLSSDFRGLRVDDTSDDLYATTFQDWSPNFGAGVFLTSSKAYVGFSVPQALTQVVAEAAEEDGYKRHQYLTAGLRSKPNDYVSLQYGALVKITEDAPAAVDAQLMATWMDVFGVGGLCRFGESAGLLVSFKLSKSLTAVYVAEAPYNTLRIRNFGTHELALRWTVSTPQRVTTNPRFF